MQINPGPIHYSPVNAQLRLHVVLGTISASVLLGVLFFGTASRAIAQSATLGVNFSASDSRLGTSGFIPPDTMGAVGPNHVGVLINGRWSVYDKSGNLAQTGKSLNKFWTDAGAAYTGNTFDPRILYDPASGRWFAAAVDNGGSANNFLIAVSASSDPTGSWTGFAVDSDTDNKQWADFPMLGMNGDRVVISANMFKTASQGSTQNVLVLPKADLLAGTPTVANATLLENVDTPTATGFTLQPVVDLLNDVGALSMLSSYNKPAGRLRISDVTGSAISPSLTPRGSLVVVTARNAPPDIDQPGAKADVDAGDNRFSGNVVRQKITGRASATLWAAHGVEIDGRAAIEWYEIDESTGDVIQNGTISDDNLALNYPSIAVNEDGDVVVGFSGANNTDTYMSAYAVVGETTGGATGFGEITRTMAGVAGYERLDGIGRNRWGDYSATVVDPTDSKVFWTFQEFASGTDEWQVQVTQVLVPEPSTLLLVLGAAGFFLLRRRVT